MHPATRNAAIGAVVVVSLGVLGYYIYSRRRQDSPPPAEDPRAPAATEAAEPKVAEDKTGAVPADAQAPKEVLPPLVEGGSDAAAAATPPPVVAEAAVEVASEEEKEIETLAREGIRYYQKKQYEDALGKFDEAFMLCLAHCGPADKTTVRVAHNRSAVLEKLNRPEDAMVDCDLVIGADPRHKKARLRRARLLYNQNELWRSLIDVTAMIMLTERELAAKHRQGRTIEQKDYPTVPDFMASLTQSVLAETIAELQSRQEAPPPTEYEMHSILESYDYYTALHKRHADLGAGSPKVNRAQLQTLRAERVAQEVAAYEALGEGDLARKLRAAANVAEVAIGCREYATAADTMAGVEALLSASGLPEEPGADAEATDEAAKAAADACLARTPGLGAQDTIRLWLLVGVFRHMRADYAGARPAYLAALGRAREASGTDNQPAGEEAAADAKEPWTLPVDPVSLEVCLLVHIADLFIDTKKYNEGKRELVQALKLQRSSPLVYLHLAHLKNITKDEAGALADLERCLEIDPENVLAHLRLAQIHGAVEGGAKLEDAKQHVAAAEDLVGGRADVLMMRGELAFLEKRPEPALKFFERAARADARNFVAYYYRAMVFMEQSRLPEAQAELAKAIELNPLYSMAILQNATLDLNNDASVQKVAQVVREIERAALCTKQDEDIEECAQLYVTLKAQVESATELGFECIREM